MKRLTLTLSLLALAVIVFAAGCESIIGISGQDLPDGDAAEGEDTDGSETDGENADGDESETDGDDSETDRPETEEETEPVDCDNDSDCDNGDACDGTETCGEDGKCKAGTPLACDDPDGNPCNGTVACDPTAGCVEAPAPTCSGAHARCVDGEEILCDDGIECTNDVCDPTAGCLYAPVHARCSNGDACDGAEVCVRFEGCQPATEPLVCDDGRFNTADTCNPVMGCVFTPIPFPTFVSIPAGSFMMGCVPGDTQCTPAEFPRHAVILDAFEMTERAIEDEECEATLGEGNCAGTWENAFAYCDSIGARLPSEAEWEYAMRGGTETIRWEWVIGFEQHPWGLFTPNVEFVQDCWHPTYDGAPTDGSAWEEAGCELRVAHGDAFGFSPRLSPRASTLPDNGNAAFRCVRDVTGE